MAYGKAVRRLNPCDDAIILHVLKTVVTSPFSLLDIGCGRGNRLNAISKSFPNSVLYGIDNDEDNCDSASKACPRATILHGDAQSLPLSSGSFHIALCECTLSLLAQPLDCLKEIFRVLRPGGFLILSDLFIPETEITRIPLSSEGFIRNLATSGWFNQAATSSGFSVQSFQDCKDALLEYVAQMIFDGSFCCTLPRETATALKNFHASYGLWVLKQEAFSNAE